MEMRTGRLSKALILSACLTGYAPLSNAFPIVQTAACLNDATATCATGVTGLQVQGGIYDVAFSQSSYDVLFSVSPPTFQDDDAGGIAAVDALIPLLNGAGIRGLFGAPTDPAFESFLFVPTLGVIAPLQFNRAAAYFTGSDFASTQGRINFTSDDLSLYNPGRFSAFAVFTPSIIEVPAPSVPFLVGLGLVGIGLGCRRRSAQG